MRKRFILVLTALVMSAAAFAQKTVYKGVVLDEQGEPLIGVSVVQKGTSSGGITDLDGNFEISVDPGSVLTISYVGYKSQEVTVSDNMNIVLQPDTKMLSDVVVIGYGTQKKSVVTASIAKVDADDLGNKSLVRMDNALKGLASGVQVTSSSGQPGAAARIRVRGTGTINNSDPLYIVDGMPIEGGLDFVNPSDIESIEVLKDAASGAIYGARAANGVILVTTKKGKSGRANINYNFSYGWQSAWKKRDVVNATDYAILQNEQYLNSGQAAPYADPYSLGKGTDWQKLVFNDNAPVVNHDLSISGAGERLNYYLSLGYYTQEGIVGGNYGQSNYRRLTMRSNTNYTLFDDTKERNYLNKLILTSNLSYARVKSSSIEANSQWGSVLGSALALSPILQPAVSGSEALAQQNRYVYQVYGATGMEMKTYDPIYDRNGNVLMIPGTAYNEIMNPLALMMLPAAKNWSHKFVANFSAELNLWDNLKYKFSYGADMSFWGNDSYVPQTYYRSTNNLAQFTSSYSDSERGTVWQLENVLSYDKTLGKHHFNIVLGQSAFRNNGFGINGSRRNLVNPEKPSINYATGSYQTTYQVDENGKYIPIYTKDKNGNYVPAGYQVTGAIVQSGVSGWINSPHTMSSLFFRGSYDYDERYMAQVTVRRDGSSRFGKNNKYGTFPSVSLGWNVMNEAFMENTRDWLSNFKVRFSWGKNGNDNIGDFRYTVLTETGSNYYFGKNATLALGSKAGGLANPDLKWEESEQTDLGFDFGFFQNALTLGVDFFSKKTNGMLMTMNIPGYVGESKPIGNVGDMENKGVEFELGYKWNIGPAKFSVRGNASYLKNELLQYGNETGFADLDSFHGAGVITRAQNGLPFPFFYGFKTAGVFQNMQEVQSYTTTLADGTVRQIQPDAVPGDVRFVDVNGDGQITNDDRTNIGNGTPKWTFGLNFNAEWKGFDFNMFWQGVSGVDVFDATHRTDIATSSYPTWMLERWTGEGTSDRVPRLVNGDAVNWQSSDLYIYDGSYLRLKNISVGYTLPQNLTKKFFVQRLRFFVMAENLITWTKYHGFDPEISSGGTSLGVDYGVYPQARTWTVGFNISL